MEVVVENASNIPEGSILSIRAGNVRRQGTLPADKPVRFAQTSLMDACPFKVDLFAPLGTSRVVLRPKTDRYTVSFGEGQKMNLDLLVRDMSVGTEESVPAPPQKRGEDALSETEAYLKKHELQHFIQNLMTSVLADKPDDPFAYMAHHLGSSVKVAPPPTPSANLAPAQRRALQKKLPRLMPHKKGFDQPAFVVEDFDGKLLTLRQLEAKDVLPPGAELRRLLIDDLSRVFPGKNVPSPLTDIVSRFVARDAFATQAISFDSPECVYQMPLAGARSVLHFEPQDMVATVVTCGGDSRAGDDAGTVWCPEDLWNPRGLQRSGET